MNALRITTIERSPVDDLRDRLERKKIEVADLAIMHAKLGDMMEEFDRIWPPGLKHSSAADRDAERSAWFEPCRLLEESNEATYALHVAMIEQARDLEYELAHAEADARNPGSDEDHPAA